MVLKQGSALGAVFDHSPMAPIVHLVKACLAAWYSSGFRHPSIGWVWELRVEDLVCRHRSA